MDSDDSINDCHHTSNDDLAEEQYEDIIASSSDHVDASTWSFLSYTTTGARYTGNLNNRVSVQPDLTLNYNSSDILLLEKTKQGALQALSSMRDKLNKISTESLSAIDCQYSNMEQKLWKYQSFKKITRDRHKYSFYSFLHLLSDHVQFNE